jgi:hypothetical protein
MRPRSHVVRGFYIFWRAPRGRENPTTSSLEVSLACFSVQADSFFLVGMFERSEPRASPSQG